MEVKNGFLIFTDVEGVLCCVRSNTIDSIFVDGDENLYIVSQHEQYQVLDVEAIPYTKLIDML